MAGSGNRERLLDIALQLFAAKGYGAVGVQKLVTEAGVTKPTLYHYFQSKSGLLAALYEREFSALMAQLSGVSTYNHDLPDTLYRVMESYLNHIAAHPDFHRLYLSMYFLPPEHEVSGILEPRLLEITGLFMRLFEAASEDHGNMRGRAQRYAATLHGFINTYAGFILAGHLDPTPALVRAMVHQFSHGIYS